MMMFWLAIAQDYRWRWCCLSRQFLGCEFLGYWVLETVLLALSWV